MKLFRRLINEAHPIDYFYLGRAHPLIWRERIARFLRKRLTLGEIWAWFVAFGFVGALVGIGVAAFR